ncbi:MAG: hypothetical protein WCC63_01165 [Candidatus Bathyarchaeia archaeon]
MKLSTLALVNLILATVLLFTPLLVGVTASAPYNPWYDLDENGEIDIFDVVRIAGTYGTTGDPGKNVSVTNWPPSVNVTVTYATRNGSLASGLIPLDGSWSTSIDTRGYRAITLTVELGGVNPTGQFHFYWRVDSQYYPCEIFTVTQGVNNPEYRIYEVVGERLGIVVSPMGVADVYAFVSYYVTA